MHTVAAAKLKPFIFRHPPFLKRSKLINLSIALPTHSTLLQSRRYVMKTRHEPKAQKSTTPVGPTRLAAGVSTYTFPSAFDGQPFLEAGLDLQTVAERGSPPLLHHDELARDERALNLELHHTLRAERVCVILFLFVCTRRPQSEISHYDFRARRFR